MAHAMNSAMVRVMRGLGEHAKRVKRLWLTAGLCLCLTACARVEARTDTFFEKTGNLLVGVAAIIAILSMLFVIANFILSKAIGETLGLESGEMPLARLAKLGMFIAVLLFLAALTDDILKAIASDPEYRILPLEFPGARR